MSTLRFEDLSDEVLLEIFSFLDVQDLLRCAMTSKRIRAICLDSSLPRWKKINLYFKTVPTSFIEFILDTGGRGPGGCKYLSLWSADISGRNLVLNKTSQLNYLDLNYCKANDGVLETMIAACDSLQKLSMANLTLNPNIMYGISMNGKTLQTLNIGGCRGLQNLHFISKCVALKELNLGSMELSLSSINFLVENLTPKIEKLGLSELIVCDFHIEVLLSRCNRIKELDLKNTLITQISANRIMMYLYTNLEKLDLSYTKIRRLWPAMPI